MTDLRSRLLSRLDQLKKLCDVLPGEKWVARVRRTPGTPTVSVEMLDGTEVIAWPGFDSSDVAKTRWASVARFISEARSAMPLLIAAIREEVEAHMR